LSQLAADCGLNEGIAFRTVEIGHFQINLVLTIFTGHGQADQLAVNEVCEFTVKKYQHEVQSVFIGAVRGICHTKFGSAFGCRLSAE
jgi:TctA family transporter